MADGAPNGYSIITFDGQSAMVDFKAARRPASYQLHVEAPEVVPPVMPEPLPVYVNVFGGSERSTVEMRLGNTGPWQRLEKVMETDPYFLRLKEFEKEAKLKDIPLRGRPLPKARPSHHLWKGFLPSELDTGLHRICVRTEDQYGRSFNGSRSIRVE
jgi:hypothetical protein